MRLAADMQAPQAAADASRRDAVRGAACATAPMTMWRTLGEYGFAGLKPISPMVSIPANVRHAGNTTGRRLSEASP